MNKYISHYWCAGGVKAFDTETGAVSDAPHIKPEDAAFGSVWKQNGKWFAFHNDEKSFMLQHKQKIWRVAPDYTVSLRVWVIFRNFRIRHHGKLVFPIRYKPKCLFFWLIDPTYDSIDAESDDFSLYVKNMWQHWSVRPEMKIRTPVIRAGRNVEAARTASI
ncbi:MAG: hypothetical protein JW943_16005 [Deltaproteobacteria bacterium]|nr:hypothetical protein [Deltaproteobacteria bacterium]